MRTALDQQFSHNVTAYDPDGDSLSYALMTPLSYDFRFPGPTVTPVPGYVVPDGLRLNPVSGELVWEAAGLYRGSLRQGEYVVAVQVSKWWGKQLTSRVVRDFHIIVVNERTQPPAVVLNPEDLQLEEGNIVRAPLFKPLEVRVKVARQGADSARLVLFSELLLPNFAGNFTRNRSIDGPTGTFTIQPTLAHQRNWPYILTFRTTYYFPNQPPAQQDLTVVIYIGDRLPSPGDPDLGDPAALPVLFKVYPNPAQEYFLVEVPAEESGLLELYDVVGRLVLQQPLISGQTRINRQPSWAKGIYLYSLSGDPRQKHNRGRIIFN